MEETQEASIAKVPTYEELKQELATIILATDSPVKAEPAFQLDREQFDSLITEQTQNAALIELLQSGKSELTQAEHDALKAEWALQRSEKKLMDYAGELGTKTFAALKGGLIEDNPRYQDRKNLDSGINALSVQQSSLTVKKPGGLFEQAAFQSQKLKLIALIKLEESKIKSADVALGEAIIVSESEDSAYCNLTESIIGHVKTQRNLIKQSNSELVAAKNQAAIVKTAVLARIQSPKITDLDSISTNLIKAKERSKSISDRLTALQDSVAQKTLGYEWLRHNDVLKEKIIGLENRQKALTPSSISFWPFGSVVLAGYLLSGFGSEPLDLSAFGLILLYSASGLGGALRNFLLFTWDNEQPELGEICGIAVLLFNIEPWTCITLPRVCNKRC